MNTHGDTQTKKVLIETPHTEANNATTETREAHGTPKQLTCERCGHKTEGGAWLGFVYVGSECITKEDKEYIE